MTKEKEQEEDKVHLHMIISYWTKYMNYIYDLRLKICFYWFYLKKKSVQSLNDKITILYVNSLKKNTDSF